MGSCGGLTGNGWKFNSIKDFDLRGGVDYKDALELAFERTGIQRDQFDNSKFAKDANGKSIPVEWEGPNNAKVNIDIPEWSNVKSD